MIGYLLLTADDNPADGIDSTGGTVIGDATVDNPHGPQWSSFE